MTCPYELTLSMFADGELEPDAATAVEAHLAECAECRARVAGLRREAHSIAAALAHQPEPVAVPAFRPPAAGSLAAVAALVMLAAMLISAAQSALQVSLPAPLAWFDPFENGDIADLAVRLVIYLARHGDTIMNSIRSTAASAAIVVFLGWLSVALRQRGGQMLLLTFLACSTLGMSVPSHALEVRHSDNGRVLVGADETVNDTLVALAENVEIDGNVQGDLIALGRRVTVRGRVGGSLFTAGRDVTIDGEVIGSVVGVGETVDVTPPKVGRNLYAFGGTVTTSQRTAIGQNAVVFAQRAGLSGSVDRDLLGFGKELELGSTVGGGVTAYADRVTLLAPAKVGGDLVVHVPQKDHLSVSESAQIAGTVSTELPQRQAQKSEYATGNFYLSQVLRYAAAFVMGFILLALIPDLRRVALHDAGNALVAGGVGLVTLAAVPIIAVLAAITIIGIPVALVGLLLWFVGLYFAKIVLGHFIGTRMLGASRTTAHFALALAVGLLAVLVAVNLPFVGGILNVVLTICGLGMLVLFLWDAFRGEPDGWRDGEPV